jgi:CDP-diacylglycerol--glycerol-3-phosphate 3-phosphatidyltransferase
MRIFDLYDRSTWTPVTGGKMDYYSRRLIPQSLQEGFIGILSPLVTLLSKWKLSPNSLTVAGVVITAFGAAAFGMGFIRPAGLLILTGGICDTIDGMIARLGGKASRFGALLDSSVDRYAEFCMFVGIAAYFIHRADYGTSAGAVLALCGSFMVSYTRARAESLGFEARIGIMQRPERILLIGLGALIHIAVFKLAIWLVALLANWTALQRIRYAYKQDSAAFKEDVVLDP